MKNKIPKSSFIVSGAKQIASEAKEKWKNNKGELLLSLIIFLLFGVGTCVEGRKDTPSYRQQVYDQKVGQILELAKVRGNEIYILKIQGVGFNVDDLIIAKIVSAKTDSARYQFHLPLEGKEVAKVYFLEGLTESGEMTNVATLSKEGELNISFSFDGENYFYETLNTRKK